MRPNILVVVVVTLMVQMLTIGAQEYCISNGPPSPVPSSGVCTQTATYSRTQAAAQAWKFAPLLYFHPLEPYLIDDVETFLSHSSLYNIDQTLFGPADSETMLNVAAEYGPRTQFPMYVSPRANATDQLRRGAALDPHNVTASPIYVNVYHDDVRNTWVYYFFWFHWYNGCSGQEVVYTANGLQYALHYTICDLGTHEGDWEGIQVEVCGDLTSVLRVRYSQHSWSDTLNCVLGECVFATPEDGVGVGETTHPLVFSALNSHASYPKYARTYVYAQLNQKFVANVDSFALADATGKGARFIPTVSNVRAVLSSPNLNDTVEVGSPYWAYWNGRFGLAFTNLPVQLQRLKCFLNNQTAQGDCPNSNLLGLVNVLLGVATDNRFSGLYGLLAKEALEVLEPVGPTGPWLKSSWRALNPDDPTPLQQDNVTLSCPNPAIFQGEVSPPLPVLEKVSNKGLSATIAIFVSLAVCSAIFTIITVIGHRLRLKSFEEQKRLALVFSTSFSFGDLHDEAKHSKAPSPKQRQPSGSGVAIHIHDKIRAKTTIDEVDNEADAEARRGSNAGAGGGDDAAAGAGAGGIVGVTSASGNIVPTPSQMPTGAAVDPDHQDELIEAMKDKESIWSRMFKYKRNWNWQWLFRFPFGSLFALCMSWLGFVVIWAGLNDVLRTVDTHFGNEHATWTQLRDLSYGLTASVLGLDGVAMFSAFLVRGAAFEFFCMSRSKHFAVCMRRSGWWFQMVVVVSMVFCSVAVLFFVTLGGVLLITTGLIRAACSAGDQFVSGVCINLEEFGLGSNVYCGDQLIVFCNDWNRLDSRQVLLGSIVCHLAQLLFLAIVAVNLLRYRLPCVKVPHSVMVEYNNAKKVDEPADGAKPETFSTPLVKNGAVELVSASPSSAE